MALFILPTYSIGKRFQQDADVFYFYDHGIYGVIRDSVLLSSAWRRPHAVARHFDNNDLVRKIIRDYENTEDYRLMGYRDTMHERTLSEIRIEATTERICDAVEDMMYSLFKDNIYDVCKSNWRWLGHDLVASVNVNMPEDNTDDYDPNEYQRYYNGRF